MKRVIFENDEGGMSVLIPAPNCKLSIEEVAKKDIPTGKAYEIVDSSEIPNDRTFRNAWKKNGKKVDIDIDKAREHTHNLRREKRAKEFKPLDEKIMKKIPETDDVAVEADRQIVRDKFDTIQTNIDNAVDEKELKQIIEGM